MLRINSRRLEAFLARRLPPGSCQTLSHRGIFILPSAFGLAWLGLAALLFLLGTNYQNNLIIGISLLLASLFVTCIIYSYRNLDGLMLTRHGLPSVYAGETLAMPLELSSPRDAWQIAFSYAGMYPVYASIIDNTKVLVPIVTHHRGILTPGRLKVESRYPLGLVRTWTWVDLAIRHPVFAAHRQGPLPTISLQPEAEDAGRRVPGMDEYQGLRPYLAGESLKQVAWKQLAQGRGMFSKDFANPQGAAQWLALPEALTTDLESALSVLSYWIDELTARQQSFGLILNGHRITPGSGESHRLACQTAIASFTVSPANPSVMGQVQ